MKKTLVIIFSIVLCIALTGAAVALGGEGGIIKKDEPISESKSEKENLSQKTDENTESIITNEPETLSVEDKALKAEIAKISDTKIDFRAKKQDKISAKTYTMNFKEFANTSGKDPRIVYNFIMDNGEEAKFTYHLNNGELLEVVALTDGYRKTAESITFEEAQKIAVNIAKQYCDTSVYQISDAKEYYQFYQFIFTRKISGYETSEGIFLNLDFNGDISYMRICLDVFEDKNITINEELMLSKLEKKIDDIAPNRKGYTLDKKRLSISNAKPIIEYYVSIENESYSNNLILQIPIE